MVWDLTVAMDTSESMAPPPHREGVGTEECGKHTSVLDPEHSKNHSNAHSQVSYPSDLDPIRARQDPMPGTHSTQERAPTTYGTHPAPLVLGPPHMGRGWCPC